MGMMKSYSLPEELLIVCLYGSPKATKILLDFVLAHPQKHKFGSVEIRNETWITSLQRRGWIVEEELAASLSGSRSVVLGYKGKDNG